MNIIVTKDKEKKALEETIVGKNEEINRLFFEIHDEHRVKKIKNIKKKLAEAETLVAD